MALDKEEAFRVASASAAAAAADAASTSGVASQLWRSHNNMEDLQVRLGVELKPISVAPAPAVCRCAIFAAGRCDHAFTASRRLGLVE